MKISEIADIVTLTLPDFSRNVWDAVALAQLYPDYEFVKQFVTNARSKRDTAFELKDTLEIGAPSSYQHAHVNMPVETAAHKLAKQIVTPMAKVLTSLTFSEDEKELQGSDRTKIIDVIQMRYNKWHRDFIEGAEHDLLSMPSGPDQHPDQMRGIPYWVTGNDSVTDLDMNGGNDPTGFSEGAGGITKAQESRWPNAVAKFSKISQDDFFDKISQFLNRVRTMAVVPNPQLTPETPNRLIYVQEPVKRAVERYYTVANEQVGTDGGQYRGANYYKQMPIAIWHAMSQPGSPVRPSTGTVRLIDWATFELVVHEAFDQKITGPEKLPNIPGQRVVYNETWWALKCTRRDRNMHMETETSELQPSAA